jgi:hypothetical protein
MKVKESYLNVSFKLAIRPLCMSGLTPNFSLTQMYKGEMAEVA